MGVGVTDILGVVNNSVGVGVTAAIPRVSVPTASQYSGGAQTELTGHGSDLMMMRISKTS